MGIYFEAEILTSIFDDRLTPVDSLYVLNEYTLRGNMKINNNKAVDILGSMIMIVAIVFLIAFWFVVGYAIAFYGE